MDLVTRAVPLRFPRLNPIASFNLVVFLNFHSLAHFLWRSRYLRGKAFPDILRKNRLWIWIWVLLGSGINTPDHRECMLNLRSCHPSQVPFLWQLLSGHWALASQTMPPQFGYCSCHVFMYISTTNCPWCVLSCVHICIYVTLILHAVSCHVFIYVYKCN